MSEALKSWLTHELEQRGWSHSELARRTGLSQTIISRILSGDRNPSADFCIKIANTLGESPEKLLRLAGILPLVNEDSLLAEINDLVKNLPLEQRREALRYIRYLYQQTDQDNEET